MKNAVVVYCHFESKKTQYSWTKYLKLHKLCSKYFLKSDQTFSSLLLQYQQNCSVNPVQFTSLYSFDEKLNNCTV